MAVFDPGVHVFGTPGTGLLSMHLRDVFRMRLMGSHDRMIINTNIAMNNKQNYTAPEVERVELDLTTIIMGSPESMRSISSTDGTTWEE